MIRGQRIGLSFWSILLICIRGLRCFVCKGCWWTHWCNRCCGSVHHTTIPTAPITVIPQSIVIIVSTVASATGTAKRVLSMVVTSVTTVVRHGLSTCVYIYAVYFRSTIRSPSSALIIVPFHCSGLCSDRDIRDIIFRASIAAI